MPPSGTLKMSPSVSLPTVCLSSGPALRLSLCSQVCQTADTHSRCSKLSRWHVSHFWCHIPVVILLSEWQLALSNISRVYMHPHTHTHTHMHTDKNISTHVYTLTVMFALRASTVQPWANTAHSNGHSSFGAVPPYCFLFPLPRTQGYIISARCAE